MRSVSCKRLQGNINPFSYYYSVTPWVTLWILKLKQVVLICRGAPDINSQGDMLTLWIYRVSTCIRKFWSELQSVGIPKLKWNLRRKSQIIFLSYDNITVRSFAIHVSLRRVGLSTIHDLLFHGRLQEDDNKSLNFTFNHLSIFVTDFF